MLSPKSLQIVGWPRLICKECLILLACLFLPVDYSVSETDKDKLINIFVLLSVANSSLQWQVHLCLRSCSSLSAKVFLACLTLTISSWPETLTPNACFVAIIS